MLGFADVRHTMIRKLAFSTGVTLLALTSVGGTAHADALNSSKALWWINGNDSPFSLQLKQPEPLQLVKPEEAKPKPPEPKPVEPVKYTVLAGDNLTKIAAAHSISWLRIWNKNTELTNPDLIYPGQVFLIPDDSEQLADRPVPQAVVQQLAPAAAPGVTRGATAGNTYDAGYCTWYVKNRRPDLPNNLGNANTWYSRAAAEGYSVGSTPRAGAVGTTTAGDLGHVVYVERVNGDGSIVISEMNYAGLYSQRTRTASAGEFLYIY